MSSAPQGPGETPAQAPAGQGKAAAAPAECSAAKDCPKHMVLSKALQERMHILPSWGLMDLLSSSGKLCKHGENLTMEFIKANPWHVIQCDSTEQTESSQALTCQCKMDGAFSCRLPWLGSLELPSCAAARRTAKVFSRKPSAGAIQPHVAAPPVQSPAAPLQERPQRCKKRMHRHAKPLCWAGSQWSGLNPESKADVPQQALLLLGESSFVLQSSNRSEVFPIHCTAQGRISASLWELPSTELLGAWPWAGKASCTPRLTPLLMESLASPSSAFLQQRQIGLRQGRAASAQEKTSAPVVLNLPFDPWGRDNLAAGGLLCALCC